MRVCIVNYAYDPEAGSPATLLDRYPSLTGWSEALLTAGAETVTVVQRFSTTAHLARAGVQYHFIADGAPPVLRSGAAPYEPGARPEMSAPTSYT